MAMKNKRKDIAKRSLPTDAELTTINSNNGEAGKIISGLTAGHKAISYESRDIPLYDIRLNADNEIFRQADTDDDIVQLAEDIQRNGLMHNLVVFPQEEDGKKVYVLLSGERRYRAMVYLEKRGDASWNTVKSCRVITSELSENEKKVLLYSANLQVRGGFADEQIRRKAIGEFVDCLQKEPYNMTEADAKKAVKEVSSTSARQIDRDFRIEEVLDKDLLAMLDAHKLTRIECENYILFEPDVQHKIAEHYAALNDVDCGVDDTAMANRLAFERDSIHYEFMKAIDEVRKIKEPDARDEKLDQAFTEFDAAIGKLRQTVDEYKTALNSENTDKADEIEKAVALEQEDKRAAKNEEKKEPETAIPESATFVEKTIKPVADKIIKKMESKNYKRGVKKMSQERRDNDIAILNQLIEEAQSLKAMIESAE